MTRYSVIALVSLVFILGCNNQKSDPTMEALAKLVEYYEEIERNIGPNEENYDPDIFALEASRGELREEYFGIRLADLGKDANGNYTMTDEQRQIFINNLLGTHNCSLQWLSWKKFGKCNFTMKNGKLTCNGQQRNENGHLIIEGVMEVVNPLHLRFTGTIKTQLKDDKEVTRKGTYNFKIKGKRAYWRMQEINNPVYKHADYIDIYF